jgi:hypothetical protein
MKINDNPIKITMLVVCLSLSHVLSAQLDAAGNSMKKEPSDSLIKEDKKINLVFKETSEQRANGSMN